MGWFVDAVDSAAVGVMNVVQNLVPAPPPELVGACAQIQGAVHLSAPLAVFMPLEAIVTGVGIIVGVFATVVVIRIFRISVSVGSGGGGA